MTKIDIIEGGDELCIWKKDKDGNIRNIIIDTEGEIEILFIDGDDRFSSWNKYDPSFEDIKKFWDEH